MLLQRIIICSHIFEFFLSFVTISVYARFQCMCKLFYDILPFFRPMVSHMAPSKIILHRLFGFLGSAPDRKLLITPTLLLRMVSLLDPSNLLQTAMRALFLVAFFSFLPNLVVQSASIMSPKVTRRSDFHLSPHGAFLNIHATKTIQFFFSLFVLLRLLHITFVLTRSVHQTHFFQLGQVRLRHRVLSLFVIFSFF